MRVLHLYISPGHNFFGHHGLEAGSHPVEEVPSIECVAGMGIRGDRFFGFKPDYKGQITFFQEEVYQDIRTRLSRPEVPPSVFRRNVIVSGVDLNELIDREFEVQGVLFSGSGECSPCYWMNSAFAPGAEWLLKGRGGLRARILSSGIVRSGAEEQ